MGQGGRSRLVEIWVKIDPWKISKGSKRGRVGRRKDKVRGHDSVANGRAATKHVVIAPAAFEGRRKIFTRVVGIERGARPANRAIWSSRARSAGNSLRLGQSRYHSW